MTTSSREIDFTVVVTTRNRSEDLRKTLESVAAQATPCEIIVIDDASTDGTSEMVRKEFPEVRLETAERSRGYIVQRNRAAHLARTPLLVSLDDDAIFSSPDVLGQTLKQFDDPRIGAVAIPLVDVREGPAVKQKAPAENGVFLCERFKGTAYAVRRDLFLELGGFREIFVHQGEEGDFCLRMLDQGFFVRLGWGDPIHHFESPRRDFSRVDHYGRRNDVLFAWLNVPMVFLPFHLLAVLALGLRYGIRSGRLGGMIKGLIAGCAGTGRYFSCRDSVSISTYLKSRQLKREKEMRIEAVVGHSHQIKA